jgi:hypothetical protein
MNIRELKEILNRYNPEKTLIIDADYCFYKKDIQEGKFNNSLYNEEKF